MERATTQTGTEMGERVVRIEERLDHGNRSHQEFRERIDRLESRREERARTYAGWLVGCVGTVVAFLYTQAIKPDTAEVRRMIVTESPYLQDRDRIERMLDAYDRDRDATRAELERLRLEQTTMNSKLDVLIKAATKPRR